MAAYDNVALPGAPNIATAGNYAQMLANLGPTIGDQIRKQGEYEYQQRLRDLFRGGVPADPVSAALRAGGVPAFEQLYPSMIGLQANRMLQQSNEQIAHLLDPNAPAPAAPAAGSPSQILPGAGGAPVSPAGPSGYGPESINDLIGRAISGIRGIPGEAIDKARSLASSLLNVDANTPLSTEDARKVLDAIRGPLGGAVSASGAGPTSSFEPETLRGLAARYNLPEKSVGNIGGMLGISLDERLSAGQLAQATRALQAASMSPAPAPSVATGPSGITGVPAGTSMPASTPAAAPIQPRPVKTVPAPPMPADTLNPPTTPGSAGGGMGPAATSALPANSPAYGDLQKAARLELAAQLKRNQGMIYGLRPEQAAAVEKEASALEQRARDLRGDVARRTEPTTEMKNLASGATEQGKVLEGHVAAGQKLEDELNKQGDTARVANQKLRLAQSFTNNDDFYSGPHEDLNRLFKQYAAAVVPGMDPNKAMSQEAFKKSINDLVNEQIKSLAGAGVGRIQLAEIQSIKDSVANLEMTPATNRLLLEEVNRVHQMQMRIQDLAHDYLRTHNYLDQNFRNSVDAYFRDPRNALFTREELHDPRLIAPPVAPPHLMRGTPEYQRFLQSRGLKARDPIRTQDGQIRFVQ